MVMYDDNHFVYFVRLCSEFEILMCLDKIKPQEV